MTALLGCDFSSAPTPRKPIVHAWGRLHQGVLTVERLEFHASLPAWEDALKQTGVWVGAFDLPFGLPRELVESLGWPMDWLACMKYYASLTRSDIRTQFKAFCNARPVGGKFAHRATDGPAGSSPSMKWVNPPVALMLHAGVPRLIGAGVTLFGLHHQDPDRLAFEAYPALLSRRIIGNTSYKSDDPTKHDSERWGARKAILTALELGAVPSHTDVPWPRVRMRPAMHDALLGDGKADTLDAVLCLVQAGWALQCRQRGDLRFGLPDFEPLEGWIVSA